MAPETEPFWQFMAPEMNENRFGDFWFKILGPEIAKMVQFLGTVTAGIWLFLDLF